MHEPWDQKSSYLGGTLLLYYFFPIHVQGESISFYQTKSLQDNEGYTKKTYEDIQAARFWIRMVFANNQFKVASLSANCA